MDNKFKKKIKTGLLICLVIFIVFIVLIVLIVFISLLVIYLMRLWVAETGKTGTAGLQVEKGSKYWSLTAGRTIARTKSAAPLNSPKNEYIKPEDIPDVRWPFVNLKDENDKNINMLCVRGYIDTNEKSETLLEYINKGIKLIGCSSHLSFPRKCDNSHAGCNIVSKIAGKDVEDYVLGWCHCFRDPDKYIKANVPRILISESDFNVENLEVKYVKKKYDYITVQPKDHDCKLTWHAHNKNWLLAEECIKIFSDELNLKGLIIGREGCPINIKHKNNVEMTSILSKELFLDKVRESKFMLLPNLEDASPRTISESLSLNTPIFVYENILGGWKYVNDKTGKFFNETNIKEQVQKLLKNINHNKCSPRAYYMNNHGLKNSGKQLRDFLKKIYPDLSPCKYVRLDSVV